MASLRCYCVSSSAVIIPRKNSPRTIIRASMDSCPSDEAKAVSNSVRVTTKVNKVYEDMNMGIHCYTDENGELVCEGLDEGPRLTWQDMEKLSREKKRAEEDLQLRRLPVAGGIDWSKLQAAVSMGKN
ncbi:hypothetical protein EJB05_22557 [Eragrostis curvula]|uniref:Uncharacterized protein n=2 Tax=Eragrostis curvula TaxID=38414 RepID=A0A5J9V5X5_9POAL|nr:hypothetical protein EJB05_22557 [Eragrostis curvula]